MWDRKSLQFALFGQPAGGIRAKSSSEQLTLECLCSTPVSAGTARKQPDERIVGRSAEHRLIVERPFKLK